MKKSTHTPGSATSGQVLEPGSGKAVIIPTVPVRIFTFDHDYFLCYRGGADKVVRLTRDLNSPFSIWVFKKGDRGDECTIQSSSSDSYLTRTDGGEVVAGSAGSNSVWQLRGVAEGPGGVSYINIVAKASKKILYVSSYSEGNPVGLDDDTVAARNNMFSLGGA